MSHIKRAGKTGPCWSQMLACCRHLRTGGGRRLLVDGFQLVEHAACRRCLGWQLAGRIINHRTVFAGGPRNNRQGNAGCKKAGSQNTRGTGQRIGLATPCHEARHTAAAAKTAKRTGIGTLQENDTDQCENDQKVNDDKDLLHDCCHTKEEGFAGCEHKMFGL